jgi:metacaspase-1
MTQGISLQDKICWVRSTGWLQITTQATPSFFTTAAMVSASCHVKPCWYADKNKGGQVEDPDGDRDSGFDDTICPVDFEQYGQITSDTLHRVLVTPLAPGVRLTVIFDCCHCQSCSFRSQRYLTVL